MGTIHFIATSQLFSTVSWIHMCVCVRVHLCLRVGVYLLIMSVCEWLQYVCVCGRQGMKETWRNWMVSVHHGLYFHSQHQRIRSKKFIPLLDLFFPMYEKQTWTSSGPLCAETHTAIKGFLLLQHSCLSRKVIWAGCQFEFLNRLAKASQRKVKK